MTTTPGVPPPITVEHNGLAHMVPPGQPWDIGREADLSLDDNRFLHRRFLRFVWEDGFWWIVNIGASLAATVSDPRTGTQSWLGPGARLPLIFPELVVVFTAGASSYELVVTNPSAPWHDPVVQPPQTGEATIEGMPLTLSQRQLIVALAEPMLRREGPGVITIPSNAEAAERLGWQRTKFNRKLDNVCDKLDRLGVEGLRGGVSAHATNRRARLIEWAISTGLVTADDLGLLDETSPASADDVDD